MGDELCDRDNAKPVVARDDAALETSGSRGADGDAIASLIRRAVESPGPNVAAAGTASRVQRSEVVGAAGGPVPDDVEQRIQMARGAGRPLDAPDRTTMEGALGADLSGVRVHTGAAAADLNDRIQAKAFTVGNDVFFRDGAPDTGTPDGQHLLAHELAHTMQQGDDVNRVIRREYVKCNAKQAAKPTDFFEVADSTTKTGKRKVFWRRQDQAKEGHEFKPAADQPSAWTWGTTYLYEEVETEQHRTERLEAQREQQRRRESEQRAAQEQRQREKDERDQLRERERLQREQARSKMSWFSAYRSDVEQAHARNHNVQQRKLDDLMVTAIDSSLNRIAPAEKTLSDVWSRCLKLKMGAACTETAASTLLADRPAPDGNHGDPDKDIAKRVTTYVGRLAAVSKRVEAFISQWATPLEADADDLIAMEGTAAKAREFIIAVGGIAAYQAVRSRNVTPETMKHYGTAWLREFEGVTDATMTHLTTATTNAAGDISGGHDRAAFEQFIAGNAAYTAQPPQNLSAGVTKRQWSGPNGGGGTKTLIDGLAANEATWKTTLTDAVWAAIAAKRFDKNPTGGISAFPDSIGGLKYRYFFNGTEIETFFPVGT